MTATLSSKLVRANLLSDRISRDPKIMQLIQDPDPSIAIKYLAETYSCAEADAEQAIKQLLRQKQTQRLSLLTKRSAKDVFIPPTTDNPTGKRVPVNSPTEEHPATIDASPAKTKDQKIEDVTKPIENKAQSRQQALIDGIKAVKVQVHDLAQSMYSLELSEEACGKVVAKIIEAISDLSAEQTADTVKGLASPLIGTA